MTGLIGPDGREYVPVLVARSMPFAQACVAELRKETGRDRSFYLTWRSFWVPREIVKRARDRLRTPRSERRMP